MRTCKDANPLDSAGNFPVSNADPNILSKWGLFPFHGHPDGFGATHEAPTVLRIPHLV
jgi:hypothetical protein